MLEKKLKSNYKPTAAGGLEDTAISTLRRWLLQTKRQPGHFLPNDQCCLECLCMILREEGRQNYKPGVHVTWEKKQAHV